MSIDLANDLQAFLAFATEELAHAGPRLTLDEALDLWQYQNAPEAEREQTIQAVQRGLDDMYAGRTVDAFEFAERMRQKIQSSTKSNP